MASLAKATKVVPQFKVRQNRTMIRQHRRIYLTRLQIEVKSPYNIQL
jgi:hypothetical protein